MPDSVQYTNDFYKIANIVNEWIADNGMDERYFPRMLSFVLKWLRHNALHNMQEPYSAWVTIDSKRVAVLPENYVRWTKVGLRIGQYLKTISVNAELHRMQRSEDDIVVDGLPLYDMPNGINMENYSGGYDFMNIGGDGSCMRGIGGGFPSKGYFTVVQVDDTTWEMRFDYDVAIGTQMLVEFISDGFNPNGETIVSAFVANGCHAAMDLKYEEKFVKPRNINMINHYGRALHDQERLIRAANNDLDPASMLMITRRHTRLSPKI